MYSGPFFTEEHRAFAQSIRGFVMREVIPNVAAWEDAETLPRELHRKAAAVGLLGLGFEEKVGGIPGDSFYRLVATREIARAGSGGVLAGLMSHGIALPPIAALGSDD